MDLKKYIKLTSLFENLMSKKQLDWLHDHQWYIKTYVVKFNVCMVKFDIILVGREVVTYRTMYK